MIKNIVDLGRADAVKGDFAAGVAALDATKDLPALRAEISGAGTVDLARGLIVIARAGALRLEQAGQTCVLGAGEMASVTNGALVWDAQEGAEVILAALPEGTADVPFGAIDLAHPLAAGGQPNAALVTTPMPETARHEFFDGDVISWGLWRATPYGRSPITYPFSELMFLLEGTVTVGNPDEGTQTFGAGDVFIVHRGARSFWSNSATVSKFWLIHSPN